MRMPLDDRLKDSLRRISGLIDPDVRRDLSTVRRKAHRAVIRQRITNVILVVALGAAALYLGPGIGDVIQNQRTEPADPVTPAQVSGSYRTDLAGADPALLAEELAGPWTITLSSDGSIAWDPPPEAGIDESFPRDTYQVAGSAIIMNLFARSLCQGSSVGSYRWTLSDEELEFVVVTDTCEPRRAILTSAIWSRT
jgi:hypothetical protein